MRHHIYTLITPFTIQLVFTACASQVVWAALRLIHTLFKPYLQMVYTARALQVIEAVFRTGSFGSTGGMPPDCPSRR